MKKDVLEKEAIMGKIYMTACMKGGCAKTVTTYNLAYSLQKLGKKVLAVDFDSQANLTKLAGLTEIPAIVKVGLSEAEAYVYVIETNLMQRSFTDLLPSEKAAVMAAHYDKVCCQGKRNDIIRELQILSGADPDDTCCHNGNKLKSLDVIASEYGFSSRNAARYLRLNHLIQPFKNLMDENKIA